MAESLALLAALAFLVITGITFLSLAASRSDVHEHTGTVRLEHSGIVRHEVAGEVRHTVQHIGTVHHEHALDPSDRARLDRLAEQQALEEAERARLEYAELSRKLDAVELRRRAEQSQTVELRRVRPAIER